MVYEKTLKLANHQYVIEEIIKPSFAQLVPLSIINNKPDLEILENIYMLESLRKVIFLNIVVMIELQLGNY